LARIISSLGPGILHGSPTNDASVLLDRAHIGAHESLLERSAVDGEFETSRRTSRMLAVTDYVFPKKEHATFRT